jgi:hypothetical protein
MSVPAGLCCPDSSALACPVTGRYPDLQPAT